LALGLAAPAWSFTPPNVQALDRNRCQAGGYWYGFYRDNLALKPICLKLPDAISGKMLDSNGDGEVDNLDAISSGVIFIGENPTGSDSDDGQSSVDDGDATLSEQTGGSRRIMWRQIQ
jgi:hypothetical protein